MTPKALNSPGRLASLRGLGVCWIIYGVLRLGLAVWLAVFTPTATVMFGALLVRVPDPYSLMAAFHVFYVFAIFLSALSGIFGVLAGFALLSDRRTALALAVVAAFLSLSELPIGITLAAPRASRGARQTRAWIFRSASLARAVEAVAAKCFPIPLPQNCFRYYTLRPMAALCTTA
jgi:hypothetical protein